jgi:hypothetical protein
MPAPTPFLASISIDAVIEALGAFLSPFVGGAAIIRAQENRVAPPAAPYVELTEILQVPLETPINVDNGANAQTDITGPKRIDIQIDFRGPASGDWCTAVTTIYRSPYAPAQFPDGIKPLYCSDGHQMPLTTGEQQYETRWTVTASLQYNPTVSIPQQSANILAVNIMEASQ